VIFFFGLIDGKSQQQHLSIVDAEEIVLMFEKPFGVPPIGVVCTSLCCSLWSNRCRCGSFLTFLHSNHLRLRLRLRLRLHLRLHLHLLRHLCTNIFISSFRNNNYSCFLIEELTSMLKTPRYVDNTQKLIIRSKLIFRIGGKCLKRSTIVTMRRPLMCYSLASS